MPYPRVALIGRPNVGKSTLFNRFCGKKLALVEDRPGVTRDWREGRGDIQGIICDVIDTPGLEGFEDQALKDQITRHTTALLKRSDLLLFVVDAREGLLASDRDLAHQIRLSGKPVILLVNKSESQENATFLEAQGLGLSDHVVAMSGLHGLGLEDLFHSLKAMLPQVCDEDEDEDEDDTGTQGTSRNQEKSAERNTGGDKKRTDKEKDADETTEDTKDMDDLLQVAIFGRPNAGKSTLINRLLGTERLLVGEQAGITRDALRLDWTYQGRALKLVDTAGVRRRSRVTDPLERLSVRDALQAVRFSQVCVLVVDALSPIDKQDLLLASKILEEGRALVLAINKWDRPEKESFEEITYKVGKSLSQVKGVPIIPISALEGKNLDRLMAAVFEMEAHWKARIPTAELNRWLAETTARHPPPLVRSTRVRLKYATQIKTRPPTIALFVSKPQQLPESYLRYLTTSLREDFNLPGVPLRLLVRKGKNPYSQNS